MATAALLFMCGLVATGLAAKLPKNWKVCSSGDGRGECLKDAIQQAISDLVPGMQSLGVFPIDPLHFDAITIDQGTGPVSIKLEFTDLDVTGVKDVQLDTVTTDWKTMTIPVTAPAVTLKGKYKIGGKILLLPITGEGDCVLKLDKFVGELKIYLADKSSGSKVYLNADKMELNFDVEKLEMQFENLFNGDKALGDNMNKFLNENWKEILNELKPNIGRTFSAAFKEIGNRVFSKFTKDQIIPA